MNVACAPGEQAQPADASANGFTPAADNARWLLQGEVTVSTAPSIFEASSALPLPSSGVVDCDGVRLIDSTAVALLLALKRRASGEHHPIVFENIPAPLLALAAVYGVDELLAR